MQINRVKVIISRAIGTWDGGCAGGGLSAWLLLGEAVESAQAPDQFSAIDRDNGAFGKHFFEDSNGPAIV